MIVFKELFIVGVEDAGKAVGGAVAGKGLETVFGRAQVGKPFCADGNAVKFGRKILNFRKVVACCASQLPSQLSYMPRRFGNIAEESAACRDVARACVQPSSDTLRDADAQLADLRTRKRDKGFAYAGGIEIVRLDKPTAPVAFGKTRSQLEHIQCRARLALPLLLLRRVRLKAQKQIVEVQASIVRPQRGRMVRPIQLLFLFFPCFRKQRLV